ncbi:MAG: hypothetical protein ABI882_03890 [Acidobacteriota bacterium]
MIRRLNYTGRTKISRKDIRLKAVESGQALAVEVNLALNEYQLPNDALVFVEAYRQTTWMRFPLGVVGDFGGMSGKSGQLNQFDSFEGILFRVKVTQATDEHVLLAEADRIPLSPPGKEAESTSLLQVVPSELGDELWQVDIDSEPYLLVNKAVVADWRALASSPIFQSLVYPEVLRRVLERALIIDKQFEIDDGDDWRSQWLRFATQLPGVVIEVPGDEESALRWIADAVAAFSKKNKLRETFSEAWQPLEAR